MSFPLVVSPVSPSIADLLPLPKRPHGVLGSSSANIWAQCSGSIFLRKELPPELPTKWTEEGTDAHDVGEIIATDFLGWKTEGTDPEIRYHLLTANPKYTEEMIECGKAYRDVIWEKGVELQITDKAYMFEEKLIIDETLDMYGYADFVAVYIDDRGKRAGYVIDYKYGYKKVFAEKNYQLAFLAVALREEFLRLGKDLDYVRAAIFQPRAPGEPYSEVTFTRSQLITWKNKFIKAAEQIFVKKQAKFKAGEHCRYCKAQAKCVAYEGMRTAATGLQLAQPNAVLPAPETLPDEVVGRIALRLDEVKDFVKACRQYVIAREYDNKPIPGVKVVAGVSRRKIIDEVAAMTAFSQHLDEDELCNRKIKGIGELEKTLKKKIGKTETEALLEPYIGRTQPALSVVGEDDPRQRIQNLSSLLSVVDDGVETDN